MSFSRFFGTIAFVLALGLLVFLVGLPTRIPSGQVRFNYLLFSSVMLLGTLHYIIPIPEPVNTFVSGVVFALMVVVCWRFVNMKTN